MGGRFCSVVVFVLALVVGLRADGPFIIELSARADGGQRAVTSRSTDAITPARLSLTTRPQRKLEIKWSVAGANGARSVPDVTVHVFLERVPAGGQANTVTAGPGALYDSAVISDVAPGSRCTGQVSIDIPEAGNYVLRVETRGAAIPGREQAAAINLVVSP